MMCKIRTLTVLLSLASLAELKIVRNTALMEKMMSDMRRNRHRAPRFTAEYGVEPAPADTLQPRQPTKVLNIMQNVLCRNFPSVPCNVIQKDDVLQKLIQLSIQQINNKNRLNLYEESKAKPTMEDLEPKRHPTINSAELSNFLKIKNTGYWPEERAKYERHEKKIPKKISKNKPTKHVEEDEQALNSINDDINVYGKKKIRKFYPHKVKYKDKSKRVQTGSSGEQLSASVEMSAAARPRHLAYRPEADAPDVWRIDYMKHGEPSLQAARAQQSEVLIGKTFSGPDIEAMAVPRKGVLHPDVYIKTPMNGKRRRNGV